MKRHMKKWWFLVVAVLAVSLLAAMLSPDAPTDDEPPAQGDADDGPGAVDGGEKR